MTKLEIIEMIILAIVIIAMSIYYIIKAIKENWMGQLRDVCKKAIKEAEEKYPEGLGPEKKQYVIAEVKKKCDELGIPYDWIWKLISRFIDNIIEGYNTIVKNKQIKENKEENN